MIAAAAAQADSHREILGWISERAWRPKVILHIDMHHDLGADCQFEDDLLSSGNVLRHIIARFEKPKIIWVLPVLRRSLLGSVYSAFVNTLPQETASSLVCHEQGRSSSVRDGAIVEIRAADDLPPPDAISGAVVSYDLDFHYHRALAGPTISPEAWLKSLDRQLRIAKPMGIFLARSLDEGYVPPTYRPVAIWLTEWLHRGRLPAWGHSLWTKVIAEEAERLAHYPKKMHSVDVGDPPKQILQFWRYWNLYMNGRYAEAASGFSTLQEVLRPDPLEELLVDFRHGLQSSPQLISRALEAKDSWLLTNRLEIPASSLGHGE